MPNSHSDKPLLVLALGGHGISAPHDISYGSERQRIAHLSPVLRALGERYRLLLVHGNGPQVGRFLTRDHDLENLDIHTAQTQGELGYLLSQALPAPSVTLATRVVVSDDVGPPIKAIGPLLQSQPQAPCKRVSSGWRILVPSPRPEVVVESAAIEMLLIDHHVVAGGGGGVPLGRAGGPLAAVVDKDWVASLLAITLDARYLIFATDVDGVYKGFDGAHSTRLAVLSVAEARSLLEAGLESGSMAPKVASAAEFAQATGRRAVICAVDAIADAVSGRAGTSITAMGLG